MEAKTFIDKCEDVAKKFSLYKPLVVGVFIAIGFIAVFYTKTNETITDFKNQQKEITDIKADFKTEKRANEERFNSFSKQLEEINKKQDLILSVLIKK